MIEVAFKHKETGGLQDVISKEDADLTDLQLGIKAWFFMCEGNADTMEFGNENVHDLTGSIYQQIDNAKQQAESADKEHGERLAERERQGHEVRDMARVSVVSSMSS